MSKPKKLFTRQEIRALEACGDRLQKINDKRAERLNIDMDDETWRGIQDAVMAIQNLGLSKYKA